MAIAFSGQQIPTASYDDVTAGHDSILIDARYERDYHNGHIEGAINVPVSFSLLEIREVMANIDLGAPIIVYCQSVTCPFDETVAVRLSELGFTNVRIYPDGWVGHQQNRKEAG